MTPARTSRARASPAVWVGLALGITAFAAVAQAAWPPLPSVADVKAAHRPSDATLLDRHGEPVQTLRIHKSVRRLPWVALADMSPALLQAVVLSEDQRFYEHSGVDWPAVARSAWANAWNTRTRGASTLTMQLAGLIDDGLARPAAGRTLAQKLGQAVTATRLDAAWRKSDILEAYLNSVPFRGEVVGINALSQTLFGKHPSGLDAHEAAIAAVLVRGPNAKAETVAARACAVLQQQRLACDGVAGLAETALVRRGGMPLGEQLAPHFARQVLAAQAMPFTPATPNMSKTPNTLGATLPSIRAGAARDAGPLRSTLDAGVQRVAIRALRRQLAELTGRNVEDGAVIVLDNASGDVLAWVGSSGTLSDAPQVDGALARRQPGSTLKPFVYALAFEQRLITPASLLDDSPAQIATGSGLYLPQNYDRDFKGWVSARTALGASLNVPAVRVAMLLGPDALHARLNRLGLGLVEPAGHYGHALALGGAEVTLLALTNAYRSLANGGRWSPVRLRADESPVASKPVADPAAAFLVTHILADDNARVRTFGWDSALATRGFAAVKTGTSKDLRDNWCIGYTDRYTVGVWVGNASGAAMHHVSGVSGAAPLWQALVRHLHDGEPSLRPAAPPGVVSAAIRFDAQQEPARDEVFIAGTEQLLQRAGTQLARAPAFGIGSPRDGSLFALDPDMPPAAQRIRFEGEAGTWVLDGRRLGTGAHLWWAPWPGRHTLELRGAGGRVLQTVRFEVRGAGVNTALHAR
jgi:penicillin-binding protein 1C